MESLKFTLGFAFIVIILNILLLLPSTSGHFEAHLISVRTNNKTNTSIMDSNELRIKKVNRTYVLTGTINFFQDVGNEYQMVSYLYKNTANQYKKLPYKIGPLDFCQYFDEDKYFIEDLRMVSDIPPKGTCPFPKGIYTVNGYSLKMSNFPPVLTTGDYMMDIQTLKDGTLLSGIQFYVRLENY